MYTEQLYTPHPERSKGLPPVLLEDYLQLDTVCEELAQLKDTPEYEKSVLQTAELMTHAVHRTLSFVSGEHDLRPLTPENLADGQASNCSGYTILLSECLERAGIRHFIGFANGHAMGIVAPTETSKPWAFDALTPQFNGPLDKAIDQQAFENVPHQIAEFGRGAIKFYSRTFAEQSRIRMSFHELAQYNPWLSCSRIASITERNDESSELRLHKRSVLFMSVFDPQEGRDALASHRALRCALKNGKRADAYRAFKKVKRYFPELDARNTPEEITMLARELGSVGCVGMAKRVIDESMESFEISKDPRFKIWQADAYRRLGNTTQNPQLLQGAIRIYEKIANTAQHPAIIEAKLEKAQRQLAHLVTKRAITT